MKILYLNLNTFDTRCDSRDNTKKYCSFISIVIPLKTEYLGKKRRKQHEGYHRDFYRLFALRFPVKVDF